MPIHTKNILHNKNQNTLYFHIPHTDPNIITIDTNTKFDCNNISKSVFGEKDTVNNTQLINVNSDSPRANESPRGKEDDLISYYLRTFDDKITVLNEFLKEIFDSSYNTVTSINLVNVQEYEKGWRLDFRMNY